MPFWRAIGLGIALVVLKLLVPAIWDGIEKLLMQFFGVLANILELGNHVISTANVSHLMTLTQLR